MLYQLLKIPKAHIYLTTFNHPNSIELVQKYLFIGSTKEHKVFDWQVKLKDFLQQNQTQNFKDLLLITGSLYFASEVFIFFGYLNIFNILKTSNLIYTTLKNLKRSQK
ncbi:hypothetical protein ACEW7V_00040 [Areca yellow leaf disease phytoplasma]|uniref:hypothetical protein n=1 Tax=Areca yellow leaf disease phytoplasma TaxID=927614 RepID=UPI0035B50038